MVNGGLFADAHTHPWQGTPMLRTPLGALGTQRAQRSPRVFDATMLQARLYSRDYHPTAAELAELRSAITRRDGQRSCTTPRDSPSSTAASATLGPGRDRPRA